jgi:hypothetical protein
MCLHIVGLAMLLSLSGCAPRFIADCRAQTFYLFGRFEERQLEQQGSGADRQASNRAFWLGGRDSNPRYRGPEVWANADRSGPGTALCSATVSRPALERAPRIESLVETCKSAPTVAAISRQQPRMRSGTHDVCHLCVWVAHAGCAMQPHTIGREWLEWAETVDCTDTVLLAIFRSPFGIHR